MYFKCRSSPTKLNRKERSRRSKRDRAGSPGKSSGKSPVHGSSKSPAHGSGKSPAHGGAANAESSGKITATQVPNEALSPSMALSMRAVFAAFLWHEGIVHDAMACASFLKFHPALPKDAAPPVRRKDVAAAAGAAFPGSGGLKLTADE